MSQDAQAAIAKTIADNDIVLFMKGTKQFPQCGFSATAAKILELLGVQYKDVNVLEDQGVREGIKSGRPFRSSTSRASLSAAAISCARCIRQANYMISSAKRASPISITTLNGALQVVCLRLASIESGRCKPSTFAAFALISPRDLVPGLR